MVYGEIDQRDRFDLTAEILPMDKTFGEEEEIVKYV